MVGIVVYVGKVDLISFDSEGFFINDFNLFDDSMDFCVVFLFVVMFLVDVFVFLEIFVWCCFM